MKKMKPRDKKKRACEFRFSPRLVLALLLFVVLENMGLKLQLRRSWSSYEGFRIVAACQNWDGCCCFGQKWGRGGGGARRIYIAGDRDGKLCRNSSMPSITSSATATLSSVTLFHSSALPLSLSPPCLTLLISLRRTSHFIRWNITHPGPY